jgi:hypothetical protein
VQCRSYPIRKRGMADADGTVRANEFHQTCRGSGDGMQAKRGIAATREAPAVIALAINRHLVRGRLGRLG